MDEGEGHILATMLALFALCLPIVFFLPVTIRPTGVALAWMSCNTHKCPDVMNMTAVGFEPTQLALVELESTPLDHSGKLSLALCSVGSSRSCKRG